MVSADEYKIVRLSEEMLGDIKFLYRSAFNLIVTEDFLRKKYNTLYTGKKYIGYLAYSKDGTPAAYYGVFPYFIQYQNKKFLSAQSGDTMTHPKHQGKGLFTTLAKMTYDLAKNEEIDLIWGFPNKNSYHGFVKKLDWTHNYNIRTYVFKVNTLPLIKAAKKFNTTSFYELYALSFFRKYFSEKNYFDNSTTNAENGGVLHDDLFFKYKIYSKNFIVELEGIKIWMKLDGKLWIGDIEKTSAEKFKKAIKKLSRICFYIGCTEIVFNLSPNSYWDILLKKEFDSMEGLPIGYLSLKNSINLENIHFTGGDFDTF